MGAGGDCGHQHVHALLLVDPAKVSINVFRVATASERRARRDHPVRRVVLESGAVGMTAILPRTPSASKDSRSTSVSATITVELHDASADKAPMNLLPQGFCPERTRVSSPRG